MRRILGITGMPGVGKDTLVNALYAHLPADVVLSSIGEEIVRSALRWYNGLSRDQRLQLHEELGLAHLSGEDLAVDTVITSPTMPQEQQDANYERKAQLRPLWQFHQADLRRNDTHAIIKQLVGSHDKLILSGVRPWAEYDYLINQLEDAQVHFLLVEASDEALRVRMGDDAFERRIMPGSVEEDMARALGHFPTEHPQLFTRVPNSTDGVAHFTAYVERKVVPFVREFFS